MSLNRISLTPPGKGHASVDDMVKAWGQYKEVSAADLKVALETAANVKELRALIPVLEEYQARSVIGTYRKLTGQRAPKPVRESGGDGLPTGLSGVVPVLKHLDRLVQQKRQLEVDLDAVNREITKYEGVARLAENLKREIKNLEGQH